MSSRVRALIDFLSGSLEIKQITKALGISEAETIGLTVKHWGGKQVSVDLLRELKLRHLLEPPLVRHGRALPCFQGGGKGEVYSSFEVEKKNKEEKEKTNPIIPLREKTDLAKGIWKETLAHFKINRGVSFQEEFSIAKAIERQGFEMVSLALSGAKFEPSTESFDPSKFLRLSRVLDPTKIDRFANLGAQEEARKLSVEQTKNTVANPMDDLLEESLVDRE